MGRSPQTLASAVLFVVLAGVPAHAQKAAAVALGVSFGSVNPTSPDADSNSGPGVLLRLRGSQGFGPGIGFNWFSSDVKTTVVGERTYLGKVNVQPVMAGIGYTRRFAKFETDLSIEAGYAFNSIRGTGPTRQAYARHGASVLSLRAANSFAWKADLSFWFELGENYGLMASVGYIGVSPEVTTTTTFGTTRQAVKLGSVVTSVGVTCAVF